MKKMDLNDFFASLTIRFKSGDLWKKKMILYIKKKKKLDQQKFRWFGLYDATHHSSKNFKAISNLLNVILESL